MSFVEAVKTCLSKWKTFSGRATRSEFWWFVLFGFIVNIVLSMLVFTVAGASIVAADPSNPLGPMMAIYGSPLGIVMLVVGLFLMITQLAAGSRRLHDTGKSGWWQLILLLTIIPLLGLLALIFMIYLYAQKSQEGSNQYG